MNHLYNAAAPVKYIDLFKLISSDISKPAELNDIITNLVTSERIQLIKATGGYLPRHKKEGVNKDIAKKWIDQSYYNYLRGM